MIVWHRLEAWSAAAAREHWLPLLILVAPIAWVVWQSDADSVYPLLVLPVVAFAVGAILRPRHVWLVWLGSVVLEWIVVGAWGKYDDPGSGETVGSIMVEAFGWMAMGVLLPVWYGRFTRAVLGDWRQGHDRTGRSAGLLAIVLVLVTGILVRGQPPQALAAAFGAGDTVVVGTDYLNLRADVGLEATVIAVLPGGTALTVDAGPNAMDDYDWYRVSNGDGTTGWVAGAFLAVSETWAGFEVGDLALVAAAGLNCRSGPGLDQDVLYVMSAGTGVEVLAGPAAADGYHWYKVRTDAEVVGWATSEWLVPAYGFPGPIFTAGDQVVIDTDYLNVRSAIGLSTDVLDVLPGGTALTVTNGPILADGYAWYKVETRDGRLGWVAGAYLTEAPGLGFAVGDAVRVADGAQNQRTGPGLGTEVRRVMADDEVLLVRGGPVDADGYTWYRVRNYAGEGWAAGEFLRYDPNGFPPEEGG